MRSEHDELLDHLVGSWVEVYKKSAVTWVLLRQIEERGSAQVSELADALVDATGWRLTERGLYRTLSRMVDQGILQAESVDAARTGAKRKVFELTALGKSYLAAITEEFVTP